MSDTPTHPAQVWSTDVRPRRRRWVSVLLAVLLLISGAIVGSTVTLLVIRNRVLHRLERPQGLAELAAARLKRHYGLSPEQTRAAQRVFRERQRNLQQIRRQVQPQIDRQLDGMRADIAEILGPADAPQWRAWFDGQRRHWLPPLPQSLPTEPQEAETLRGPVN